VGEYFFQLNQAEQYEALEYARAQSGRPAHLLEKDIWVVWTLDALFKSPLAADLTFKGGTSLSKVYKVIDRFSEDIDLTYDIRKLIPDLIGESGELPASRSMAARWTAAVRHRLPEWIVNTVQPIIQAALTRDALNATLAVGGEARDKLLLTYSARTHGTGYVAPTVALEFGGRATGEPHEVAHVVCDAAEFLPDLSFPTASPVVMSIARTFWEKATAAHVYCAQGRIRGERYARHWHDLAAIARDARFLEIMADREIPSIVARHKSMFFLEKAADQQVIDYAPATSGQLKIVPAAQARAALAEDYEAMLTDNIMVGDAMSFDDLMDACGKLEHQVNRTFGADPTAP
jgi:hypothetical protein